MVGVREHVTQNVSDLTDVLGESAAGYLFIIFFLIWILDILFLIKL